MIQIGERVRGVVNSFGNVVDGVSVYVPANRWGIYPHYVKDDSGVIHGAHSIKRLVRVAAGRRVVFVAGDKVRLVGRGYSSRFAKKEYTVVCRKASPSISMRGMGYTVKDGCGCHSWHPERAVVAA